MTSALAAGNLALRFTIEVFALTAVALCVWRAVPGAARYLATAAAVAGLATVWATVVHGTATPAAAQVLVQVAALAAAVTAVALLWRTPAAIAFAAVALGNAAALAALGQ